MLPLMPYAFIYEMRRRCLDAAAEKMLYCLHDAMIAMPLFC